MHYFHAGVISAIILAGLAVGAFFLSKKLSKLRDPLSLWNTLHGMDYIPIRMRAWLFSTIVGVANPYSRSINYRITEVEKGKVCGVMKETRKISNPFRCVHAGALVTFGETVGGLAFFTHLGKKDRAILVNLNAEYIKVARGYLTASSVVPDFRDSKADQVKTEVIIRNAAFDTVAKISFTWKTDLKSE